MRTMAAIAVLASAAAMTAACAPIEGEVPARDDVRYACDAARVQSLVGQVATQAVGAEAVRTAGARTMRWIAPGQAVTMDYRTDRLNLHLDAQNRIVRIACG